MQVLNMATVKEQLDMPLAIAAIENMLKTQSNNPSWIKSPERLVIPTFDNSSVHQSGSHLSMPCVMFDGKHEYTVVKLVTICPDNPSRNLPTTVATITVSDNATGDILTFMDGIYVTQVRTAALSGIATKYMADPDSRRVAVVGTGGMAYEQLNAVLTVCPHIEEVNLWNRTTDTAHKFKEKFTQDYPDWDVKMTVCESMETAIEDADILNLATRADTGLFEVEHIKPNVHINAVGAYQPTMKEVSDSVIEASAYVVIDDLEGGKHEAGDLIQAHDNDKCDWQWDQISGQLMDLVSGRLTVDSTAQDKGITLFKSVGAASFDAAVALEIAKQAVGHKMGQTVQV